MSRVTQAEVEAIITVDSDVIGTTAWAAFITAANLLVTNAIGSDTTIGDSTKKEVERYVAAHFASLNDPRVMKEKAGDASVEYYGKTGMGLEATQYGQMALALDPSGALKKAGMKKASIAMVDYSTESDS